MLFFLLFSFSLQAQEASLTISTGFNTLESQLLKEIVQKGCKRAGFKLNFQILPNQRSLINANTGVNDGEAARISTISKIYPNLIKVDVPIHTIDIVVISKKNIKIKKMSDLKNYHLGIIRGVKITEQIAKKIANKPVFEATNYKSLIKMLVLDRVEIIIVNKLGAFTDLKKFKNTTFYLRKKPLVSPKLYTHLNIKNKSLIPKLEKAYKSMLKDGTLKKIHKKFNQEVYKELLKSIKVVPYD